MAPLLSSRIHRMSPTCTAQLCQNEGQLRHVCFDAHDACLRRFQALFLSLRSACGDPSGDFIHTASLLYFRWHVRRPHDYSCGIASNLSLHPCPYASSIGWIVVERRESAMVIGVCLGYCYERLLHLRSFYTRAWAGYENSSGR